MKGPFASGAAVIAIVAALVVPQVAFAAKAPPVQAPTAITGTLTSASRPNGAVAGATVTLYKNSRRGWAPLATTTSAADGKYQFSGIAASTYRVGFSAPGFVAEYYHDAASVAVASDVVVASGQTKTVDESLAVAPRVLAQIAAYQIELTSITGKVAVSKVLNEFYLCGPGELTVIDGATKAVTRRIPMPPSDTSMADLCVDEMNLKAYAVASANRILEIDLVTGMVRSFTTPAYATRIALSSGSRKVFANTPGGVGLGATVQALDLDTGSVTTHVLSDMPVGVQNNQVSDVFVDPTTDELYACCGSYDQYLFKYQASDLSPLGAVQGYFGVVSDLDMDTVTGRMYLPMEYSGTGFNPIYTAPQPGQVLNPSVEGLYSPRIAVDDTTGVVYAAEQTRDGSGNVHLSAYDPAAVAGNVVLPFSTISNLPTYKLKDVEVNESTGDVIAVDQVGRVYFFTLQYAQ